MHTLAPAQGTDVWSLFQFGSALSEQGLEAYLPEFLEGILDIFSADGASIFLREQESDRFVMRARGGDLSNAPVGSSFTFGEGIAGKAAKAGLPMLVDNPYDHVLLEGEEIERRSEIGSAIVIPLTAIGGECDGVLNISRRSSRDRFSADELERARAVASQLALALANARLVAELARSSAETQALHERLQAAVDGTGFALFVMNSAGRLEIWNKAAMELCGGPLHSQVDWDYLRSILPSAVRNAILSLETSTNQLSGCRRVESVDTNKYYTICATRLSDTSVVVTIQDVSEVERLRSEEARLRRLAEIGQMSAAIAHDIRNPLTGIVSAAALISDTAPEAAAFAEIISEEAAKLNLLCEDFLDFSKPIELRRNPCKLRRIVESAMAVLNSKFEEGAVLLRAAFENSEREFLVDKVRLEHAIQNLLINALQASKPGDTVTIDVSADAILIADSGCGMSSEAMESMFTPFYSTKPKGTGLGLTNVRKVIEAHGAEITVRSKLDEGTQIRLDFSHVC